MGATVLTGKRAAAFRGANGDLTYALFERTYEKNCYPHTDRWSAIAFGSYSDVMRRVFLHAGSCEGGMLQSRSGDIKPENYIESWKQELARPVRMRDREIRLRLSGSYDAVIPDKSAEDVRLALIRAGFEARFDAIKSAGDTASLHADAGLLLALYGAKGPLSAWRILDVADCGTEPMDMSATGRAKAPVGDMPQVKCYSIDGENRLLSIGAEPLHNGGWVYRVVGTFIEEVAYWREMDAPGYAKKAIPIFRGALKNARPLPADTRITVTRAAHGTTDRQVQSADRLASRLGFVRDGEAAPDTFAFDFGAIDAIDADEHRDTMYLLCSLQPVQVNWEVPIAAVTPVNAASGSSYAEGGQLALCLA